MRLPKVFRIFSFLLVSGLCAAAAAAQGAVDVETKAWPTKIHLGDEIKLFIRLDRPTDYSIEPLTAETFVQPFEVKSVQTGAASPSGGRVRETFLLVLTVFELGDLQIPPIQIIYQTATGGRGMAVTRSIPVKVVSVGKNKTDKDDIRPIKGPVSLRLGGLWTALASAVAAILAVILAVKIIIRRRKAGWVDPETRKPPHERALLELGRLEKSDWLAKGRVKAYYSELADILRRYFERRYGFEALEQTTVETVRSLKGLKTQNEVIGQVRDLLENSDLVKFAKVVPEPGLAPRLTGLLAGIVEATRPVPEKAQAAAAGSEAAKK